MFGRHIYSREQDMKGLIFALLMLCVFWIPLAAAAGTLVGALHFDSTQLGVLAVTLILFAVISRSFIKKFEEKER